MALGFSQRQAPLYGPRGQVSRQYDLAQALAQQGMSTAPVQSPIEGLSRALLGGVAGLTARKARERESSLDASRNATLARALSAGMGKPAEQVGPVSFNEQPGNAAMMAQILSGNPETADLGAQIGFGQIGRKQELADALALQDAKLKGKAPTVEGFYNAEGFEQKRQWNPVTREWETVGGTKTDMKSPGRLQQDLQTATAGKTTVTNTVNTADDKFAQEFGKQNAQQFFERQKGARDAAASLLATQEAKRLLDSKSGIISGTGANYIVEVGKALRQMGFDVAPDDIANTEAFVATRAQEVGRIIKLFGAGTGLSDADREFATKAAAGQITMEEDSIRRILDINERASRNVIELFNKDAATIDPEMSPYPLTVDIPKLPEAETGGQDGGEYSQEDLEYTAKQHGITVEEVKKRLGVQ